MDVVGILLTFGGASVALGALYALRGETCPRCGATGTLVATHRSIEETPGGRPLLRRAHRCRGCGARVEDVRELGPPPAARRGLGRRLLGALAG